MRSAIAALVLGTTISPALAQTCEAPVGTVDPCVVGAWIGSSTIPEAMERMMQSMPDTVRANFNDFGRPVGMIIHSGGFFETFPMGANGNAVFRDANGEITRFEMTAQTQTTAGYLTATGGMLDICYLPGAMGNLSGQMTVERGGASSTTALPVVPTGGFMPVITYSCAGDRMQQIVALPAPLGAITYDMARVPLDMFPEAMRYLVEDLPTE